MISADLGDHCLVIPNFFGDAKKLRAAFESKFADPRATRSDRFVWDYWHVPNQYTLIRTPARYFFPKALYEKLERKLIAFGQTQLGCNGISAPWLSYYIDGCEQKLHADNPHGPWAFVHSLTPWAGRKFTGGETQLARPRLLSYWDGFQSADGEEFETLFAELAANFNQLLVFDPRLPHGVKRVEGVRDPRDGRLVLHGWFTEPQPFLQGALSKGRHLARTGKFLEACLGELSFHLASLGAIHGTLACRLTILPSGKTERSPG